MRLDERPRRKTYSHLYGEERLPNDYTLLTSQLSYHPQKGFALEVPGAIWYRRYTIGSPLTAPDWEAFEDPSACTYTQYVQSRHSESQVRAAVLKQIDDGKLDAELDEAALDRLAQAVYPLRYPIHGLQMVAAYLGQQAPSSRITVAALFQAGDELARIQCLAQRMSLSMKAHPARDWDGKARWQHHPDWQPLRSLVEHLFVCYDWGEAFVALNLCIKPLFDELTMVHLPRNIDARGGSLLSSLFFSLDTDCRGQRAWSAALVRTACSQRAENQAVLQGWVDSWWPRARAAVAALAIAQPGAMALVEAVSARFLVECGLRAPSA